MSTPPAQDPQFLLGKLVAGQEAMIGNQETLSEKIDKLDSRLRSVETRAAVSGGVTGGVITVGMMLISETVRGWMNRGGGGT